MDRPGRISALLVEPHKAVRERLVSLLADRGVRSICTASNCDDAIERMRREAFDLVIADGAVAPALSATLQANGDVPKPAMVRVEQPISEDQLSALLDQALGERQPTEAENVEAIIERLTVEYLAKVEQHIAAINAARATACDTPAERPVAMQRIARIAHDMKGQGGSFGYPILSEIAASLVAFCRDTSNPATEQLVALDAHVDAMRAALTADLRGDIGPQGKELLASLANATLNPPQSDL